MAEPPVCNKGCGKRHYRFVRCENVDEWNVKHAIKERQRNQPIQGWKVPEGIRVWGDRTDSWDVRGNVYWRVRDESQEAS